MLPLLRVPALYLRLHQAPELTVNDPAAPVALALAHFEDNLDAFGVECMDIDPNAVVKNLADYSQRLLVPLLLCEPVLLSPEALATPRCMLLHRSRTHREQWRVAWIPLLLLWCLYSV